MSRPISFRAYVAELDKIVDVFAVNPMNQTVCLSHQQLFGTEGDDVLMKYGDEPEQLQYTGLNDKSGVEIYEGDTVKLIGFAYGYSDFVSSEVTFVGGMFCVAKDGGLMLLGGNDWEDENRHEVEVIGNIYESPDLLEPTS